MTSTATLKRGPENSTEPFEVRLQGAMDRDALYRVYPADHRLYFIRIGGSKNQAAAVHFGLIGALFAHFANKKSAKETEALRQQIEGIPPAEMMSLHKKNFFLELDGVEQAEILPRTWLDRAAGRFKIRERAGKKRNGSFDNADNVSKAINALSGALKDRIIVKVQYNELKNRYDKIPKK